MSRPPAGVQKNSPMGPEKVECSKCGRDSGLSPSLTIKNLTHQLNCKCWVPSQDSPGERICPDCRDELSLEEEYD